ncbi:MAG: hypothetical protein KDC79_08840 [Cyclobacteriaceae bacterium]|nr:hypothetical protein [Cyclobacteriaceae bacterium]
MKAVNFVFLILLFFSCSPIYYAPSAHNVPIFTEKNQGNFSIGSSVLISSEAYDSPAALGLEGQTAYSFSNHFAAQANFMLLRGESFYKGLINKNNYMEVAIGYFLPIGQNFVFEVYSGVGNGFVKNNIGDSTAYIIKTQFSKPYLQPSIGFHKKHFFTSIDFRIGHLNYHNTDHNIPISNLDEFYINVLNDKYWLVEPCLSLGMNLKKVQLKWQWYMSYNMDNKFLPQYDIAGAFMVGFLLNREK